MTKRQISSNATSLNLKEEEIIENAPNKRIRPETYPRLGNNLNMHL